MSTNRLRDLVSPKVGLIRSLEPQPRGPLEPVPPYLAMAMLSHFDFRVAQMSERIGAGKGRTAEEADASAIGEAVERYCALQWDESRTFVSTWSEVEESAIAPGELVLYAAEQYARPGFPYASWEQETATTWIHGVELPSGRQVALPASLVYLVSPAPRVEDRLAMNTSNGLAAGPSLEYAVLGGLCELIERDAMLVCWMNRLPAAELQTATAGPIVAGIVRAYARQGIAVREFVLPTDLPATVVMAIAFDDDPDVPAQVVGLGCHPDPGVAAKKAAFELCQARPSEGKRFRDRPPAGRLERYEDVATLDDHSAFASLRSSRDEFSFLSSGNEVVSLDQLARPDDLGPAELLATCAGSLAELGHRVAYTDLTLPDVAEVGMRVVRTVVTGLQPIHFGHGLERLGGSRLFELPLHLGLDDRIRTVADLNPCPHPLA